MIRLELIHNGAKAKSLEKLAKDSEISGYTTFLVHRSYGTNHGHFKNDIVSGEKYYSLLFFTDSQKEIADKIHDEFVKDGYFAVLSKI